MKKAILITALIVMSGFILQPTYATQEAVNLSGLSKITGSTSSYYYGYKVVVGDVNCDGYDDVIGSSLFFGGFKGIVHIDFGGETLLESTDISVSDVTKAATSSGDYFGSSITTGDLNSDGCDDILIGAPGVSSIGKVYLYYGSGDLSSGPVASADATFSGLLLTDMDFGSSIAVGDINGDDKNDLIIGASGYGTDTGRVYVFLHGVGQFVGSYTNSDSDLYFIGETTSNYAGYSVSVGDVDNNGNDDILIGAYGNSTNTGKAYLIYGRAMTGAKNLSDVGGSLAGSVITGADSNDQAGKSVAIIDDVNGDSNKDILIGAPGYETFLTSYNNGKAYLIYGAASLSNITLDTDNDVTYTGEKNSLAGTSVTSAGDVNGDGYNDLLIGAPEWEYTSFMSTIHKGASYIVYGGTALSSIGLSEADIIFKGAAEDDDAGEAVASGDLNNDGYSDIVTAAELFDGDAGGGTGAVYFGYVYVDGDGDGTPGTDGIFDGADTNDNDYDNDGSETGTDCNDADATIYPGAPELQDSLDNDCDGEIDETTVSGEEESVDEDGDGTISDDEIVNTPNPNTDDIDASDESVDVSAYIASVEGDTQGYIKVTYTDSSVYKYKVFVATSSKTTKVKQYKDTGYYMIMHPLGKKISYFNIFSATSEDLKDLSPNKKYKNNNIKVMKLRKLYWAATTSKTAKGKVRIAITRIKPNKAEFGSTKKVTFNDSKVKATKTKKSSKNATIIQLRNKNAKVLHKYKVQKKAKDYNLKVQ